MNPVIVKFLSARHRDRFARDGHPAAIGALHAKYAQFAAKRKLRSGRTHDGCQWEYVAIALLDIDGFAAFRRYVTDVVRRTLCHAQCHLLLGSRQDGR